MLLSKHNMDAELFAIQNPAAIPVQSKNQTAGEYRTRRGYLSCSTIHDTTSYIQTEVLRHSHQRLFIQKDAQQKSNVKCDEYLCSIVVPDNGSMNTIEHKIAILLQSQIRRQLLNRTTGNVEQGGRSKDLKMQPIPVQLQILMQWLDIRPTNYRTSIGSMACYFIEHRVYTQMITIQKLSNSTWRI